jgi:hypothetical protein
MFDNGRDFALIRRFYSCGSGSPPPWIGSDRPQRIRLSSFVQPPYDRLGACRTTLGSNTIGGVSGAGEAEGGEVNFTVIFVDAKR